MAPAVTWFHAGACRLVQSSASLWRGDPANEEGAPGVHLALDDPIEGVGRELRHTLKVARRVHVRRKRRRGEQAQGQCCHGSRPI